MGTLARARRGRGAVYTAKAGDMKRDGRRAFTSECPKETRSQAGPSGRVSNTAG